MFISKKKHQQKLKEIREQYEVKISELRQELSEAKDLKCILKEVYEPISGLKLSSGLSFSEVTGTWTLSDKLPDNILQYTEDILGGRVIKQEGTKCLVVDKEGNVKTGLTKQKADKGYTYKLVRKS